MTLPLRHLSLVAIAALGACSRPQSAASPEIAAPAQIAPAAAPANLPPVAPPAPGTPGGLPDDRTPVSEAPFREDSAQGAADVVQTYYALLGQRAYDRAWALWADGGRASGQATAAGFAAGFQRYSQYDAQVGAPSDVEGAAGSLYVTVPVVIYGRLKTGAEVHEKGEATLRRVNNVPGATPEQLKWRIAQIDLKPAPPAAPARSSAANP